MMWTFSDLGYLDEQYQQYQQDPTTIHPSWRHFFEGWDAAIQHPSPSAASSVDRVTEAYRLWGHLKARVNPLGQPEGSDVGELSAAAHGVEAKVVERLEGIYCGSMGFEYMTAPLEVRNYLQHALESTPPRAYPPEEQRAILGALIRAEGLERFLHTKFVGHTWFSLEGGEALIPMLSQGFEGLPSEGIQEVVIGMAHRGRLNVLVNVLGKPYSDLFQEFGDTVPYEGTGDVKYHKGYQTVYRNGVTVRLCANPSHLEAVDPLAEGMARARQDAKVSTLPLLIHGDASVAGQGVVYETVQLSQLKGYTTGGTIHIVINNQIGFTTSPSEGRSTRYCTDLATALRVPVFHVNGDDPEACVTAFQLALKVRNRFQTDVWIDLNCYRKCGHNEGDEPAFTQPVMYAEMGQKKSVSQLYGSLLMTQAVVTAATIQAQQEAYHQELSNALEHPTPPVSTLTAPPSCLPLPPLSEEKLTYLVEQLRHVPEGFHLHPKIQKRFAAPVHDVDWALGEQLAYASLVIEGVPVRLSGQDVQRGTFSHRHAVVVDQVTGEPYAPLNHLTPQQASFEVYNSPLSEYGVLGFEVGYTWGRPEVCVLWEAQFGDFVNTAQVVIDQFLASSEQKWGIGSGLTLLLPHGYEGQGPEHSSARLERFLQLSSQDNWRVVNPTTPAQLFHVLRSQARQARRCPLILMTPKATLRHSACRSQFHELTQGQFEPVLSEPTASRARATVVCSGKIYYDLLQAGPAPDVALIRLEQLYPFPREKMDRVLQNYQECRVWRWVQEEPLNMGAWRYVKPHLDELVSQPWIPIGRPEQSATAGGSRAAHLREQQQILKEAIE